MSAWVPSVEPVSTTMTQVSIGGFTACRQRPITCASSLTIMLRHTRALIDGALVR